MPTKYSAACSNHFLVKLALAAFVVLPGLLPAQVFAPVPALDFTKPFGGADPLPQTLTIASVGSAFYFTAASSTSSGGSWLSVTNGGGCGLCETPHAITAVVTANVALAAGTYTGQIVLTSQYNSVTLTIPVKLTIGAAGGTFLDNLPGQLSFALETGGTALTSQTIQIRNGGTGTLNWTATTSTSDGGNWLHISSTSGTAPSVVTVNITVASLPGGGAVAGTFIGQLVILTAGSSVTVPISVAVGNNILSQINGISFTKVFGGANPLPQTLTVPSNGSAFYFTAAAFTATGGSWLSIATGGSCGLCETPQEINASITASPTLAAGTYTGQIVFTSQSGTMSITVPVTLTVAAAGTDYFANLPGQLSFSLITSGTTITSQPIQVGDGGSGTLSWTLTGSTSDTGNWLTISTTSGATPSLVTVGISVANLPSGGLIAGTFIGQVVFQSANGSVSVPISVVVGNNVFSQINGINFTKVFGGANPLPQTLTVPSNGTSFYFTTAAFTATGGSWLSIATGGSCGLCPTPQTITVSIAASPALAAGTYTGEIIITSQYGSLSITVPVTLTIAAAGTPFFDNVPGAMSFTLSTGSSNNPPAQSVQIRNAGSGTLAWTLGVSTSDGGNWLSASALSGTAPSVVSITVQKQNLPGLGLIAGTFIGDLVFLTSAGNSVTVSVSVTVGASVFNQVNGISFTMPYTGADPLPQTLTIASTDASFYFTAAASTATGGSWLSISTGGGCSLCPTPETVTATITASPTLAAGTYTGQIVLTSQYGSMAITVPVTLTVAAAANGPFFDNLPGQMSFSFQPSTANPPTQTVQVRSATAGALGWTLGTNTSDGGNWLSVSAATGTTPAIVTVGVVSGNLPGLGLIAGTFTGELVFQSVSGSVTMPVSVTVGTSVFSQLNGLTFTKVFGGSNPLSQAISISSTSASFYFTTASSTGNGGNWLSIAPTGGLSVTPTSVTASIIASPTLANGTYTGQIVAKSQYGTMAMTVPVTLIVGGSTSQAITFLPLPSEPLATAPFTLSASASSGLTVLFTSNSPTFCTVSGNTVTLVSVGTCSITASQSGNAVYAAALPVTQTFAITATCTFSLTSPGATIPAAGGTGFTVGLTAGGSACGWTALSNASWLTVTSASSGTGSTTVTYNVAANPNAASLTGAITIGGQTFTVTSQGAVIALQFYPIAPCRLVDTRIGEGKSGSFGPPSLPAYTSRNFPLLSGGCAIPLTGVQAYSLNFTAVPDGPLGFLSVWPTGSAYPGVSTLNSTDGSVIANAAIVPAGTGGNITVVAGDPTDLIIDINGYFAPAATSGLDFYPLTPCRIADTRAGEGKTGAFGPPSLAASVARDFPIDTSPCLLGSPQAYSLNITVVPDGPLGFLSVWPVGLAYPGVSTLNSSDGIALANAAIVPAGTNGDIDVVPGNPTDLIIDINGIFAAPATGGLQFYAVTPCRVADTRTAEGFTGSFGPPSLATDVARNFPIQSSACGIPSTAQAYALNMTAVPDGPLGFLSTWPTGQAYPGVSTLNSSDGNIIANAAIVPAGTGGSITVVAGNPTDLIIDIVGYFAP